MKMWSHYADDCRGVVIGYNVDLWVRHLFGTSIIRQVKYADDLPIVMGPRVVNQENAYAFMSSKGAAWEYEQEWRLITELSKTQQSGKDIAVITVPQESVSSILITDRTSQDTVDIIVRRLNNPSNDYRIWWIDKMQRGHDATTLAFIGQIKRVLNAALRRRDGFVNASNWHTARDDLAVVPDARAGGSGTASGWIRRRRWQRTNCGCDLGGGPTVEDDLAPGPGTRESTRLRPSSGPGS